MHSSRSFITVPAADFNNESHRRRCILVRMSTTISAPRGMVIFLIVGNERLTMQYVLVSYIECAYDCAADKGFDDKPVEFWFRQFWSEVTVATMANVPRDDELNSMESINFCFVREWVAPSDTRISTKHISRSLYMPDARIRRHGEKSYLQETLLIWICQGCNDSENAHCFVAITIFRSVFHLMNTFVVSTLWVCARQ